ncbi:hypothetical protein [Mesorhizobium sp.]|uniref:hypothetical protein n=1 Tax=Mesorhizobium sp. TaxID=1871066 RepID=UPI000FE57AF9|nr:hypothetical protein [Mesorhizobium sp.]RWO49222.1 MAG: hypothetical protein EOS13_23070 [Mesorhizobium sp.]
MTTAQAAFAMRPKLLHMSTFAILFTVAASSVFAQPLAVGICDVCDREIEMTQADAQCFSKQIGRYLEEAKSVSPIFLDITQCPSDSAQSDSVKLPAELVIKPPAPEAKTGRFYVLSLWQLECIAKNLTTLMPVKGPTIRFAFDKCGS